MFLRERDCMCIVRGEGKGKGEGKTETAHHPKYSACLHSKILPALSSTIRANSTILIPIQWNHAEKGAHRNLRRRALDMVFYSQAEPPMARSSEHGGYPAGVSHPRLRSHVAADAGSSRADHLQRLP